MKTENKKDYLLPKLEFIPINDIDIIRTSDGTDAPIKDDPFGEWEI